jgi:hypothetical protein
MRYSTSSMFVIIAAVALILWCGLPTTDRGFVRYITVLAAVGAFTSVRFRSSHPYRAGAIVGLGFFAFSLACWWAQLWLGYFLQRDDDLSPPIFDDGVITVGVIYPFVYLAIYGPIASMITLLASAATMTVLTLTSRFVEIPDDEA